jgi:hypothetical protein
MRLAPAAGRTIGCSAIAGGMWLMVAFSVMGFGGLATRANTDRGGEQHGGEQGRGDFHEFEMSAFLWRSGPTKGGRAPIHRSPKGSAHAAGRAAVMIMRFGRHDEVIFRGGVGRGCVAAGATVGSVGLGRRGDESLGLLGGGRDRGIIGTTADRRAHGSSENHGMEEIGGNFHRCWVKILPSGAIIPQIPQVDRSRRVSP